MRTLYKMVTFQK